MDDSVLLDLLGMSHTSSQSDQSGDEAQRTLASSNISSQLTTHKSDDGNLFTVPYQAEVVQNGDVLMDSNIIGKERNPVLLSAKVLTSPTQAPAQTHYGQSRNNMLTSLAMTSTGGAHEDNCKFVVSVVEGAMPTLPFEVLSGSHDQSVSVLRSTHSKPNDGPMGNGSFAGNCGDTLNDTPIYITDNLLTEDSISELPSMLKTRLGTTGKAVSSLNISQVSHVVHSIQTSGNNECAVTNHKMEEILKQPYMCAICGNIFGSIFEQRSHVIEDHLEVPESVNDKETLAGPFDTVCHEEIDLDCSGRKKHKKRLRKEKLKRSKKKANRERSQFVASEQIKEDTLANNSVPTLHMSTDTGSSSPSSNNQSNATRQKVAKVFKCEFCEDNFTSNKYRYKHRVATHPDSLFECPGCTKSFKVTDKDKWQHHIRIHNNPSPKPKLDFYRCTVCGMVFRAASSVAIHVQNIHPDHDHDDKPFCCEVCGNMFRTKRALKSHQSLVHSDLHPFLCTVCNRSFKMKSYLKLHERQHTGDRPFSCQFCAKVFRSSGARSSHERSHTNERPYKCSYCESTFKTKPQTVVHQRTHTKEKPYLCHLCNKPFATRTSFNTHQFLHTGQKPHQCTHCSRAFAQKANLNYHFRSVHCGEKPYPCTVCELRFSRSTSRKLHMEKKHGLKITVMQGRPPLHAASVVELETGLGLEF